MKNIRIITRVSILGAIGFLLMMLEFPILPFANFLKLNFSDVPALLAAFSMGPFAGLAVVLLENLLHLFVTNSGGVGELANFLVSGTLVLTAGAIYRIYHTRRGAIYSLLIGSVCMLVGAMAANFFILFPLYMPGAPAASRLPLIWSAVLPFNAIKAVLVSLIILFLYKPLSQFFKEKKKAV